MLYAIIVDVFCPPPPPPICVQRAPPHQIGDTALPRSDPNLSAPDKGKTLHLCILFNIDGSILNLLWEFLLFVVLCFI